MKPRPAPSALTLQRLKDAAGAGGHTTDASDMAPHLKEWRERFVGTTPLLLKPNTKEAISAIVKICNETDTAIVPQGGNTGLVGGQIPSMDGNEILLCTSRLNRVLSVDADANTLTAEAGCILTTVQERADTTNRLFPLSLASEGSATIGGLISTNAGGTGVLAYGNMRELVLGIEAVLPNGEIWQGLRALRKDNTGYDIKNLLIGAEGTLGIVTGAVLKLFPKPLQIETAFVTVPSLPHAINLLNHAQSFGIKVTAFELIPHLGLEFVLKHIPNTRAPFTSRQSWYVLIDASIFDQSQCGSLERMLTAATDAHLITDATLASSMSQRKEFWRIRDSLSEAQKPEGGSIKHDVSVPISSIPKFIEEASNAVLALIPGARPVPFGHLGDGNIHFNISQPQHADKEKFLGRWQDVNRIVHDIVHKHNGSISAEHGIGQAKVDEMTRYKSHAELDAMRAIKRALDPNNILNPGKVVRA